MNSGNIVGQTLDDKYRIERELGKGGMGAVYLATHIGTERPVAIKVIVPQFMQKAEFVERFKREARAAGRLRHPNVVDVTDFGFAETANGRVAYLVMEYLDGCTLGEILEEEKQLPLSWSLDILEQVCSAVREAHEQGIIHRDLKPDNIWLEPDGRGGYTVKVLDFGIAKLEENHVEETGSPNEIKNHASLTNAGHFGETVSEKFPDKTLPDLKNSTAIYESGTAIFRSAEGGTLLQPVADLSEKGTAIMPAQNTVQEDGTAILPAQITKDIEREEGTKLISQADNTDESLLKKSTGELTRVGAVLGTPLYMSPEQCRGEKLDARSDIYSLAVIFYQMLGGKTPFQGDWKTVMQAHKEIEPPILEAKKVPKKVKATINSALSKNIDDRPQTAESFAAKLRAGSEGIGELLRKSLMIYSEHIQKFLLLSFLLAVPAILFTILRLTINLLRGFDIIEDSTWYFVLSGLLGLISFFVQIFMTAFLVGITTWIVAQVLALPLRPIDLRAAYKRTKSRWKYLAGAVTASTLLAMLGTAFCFLPGIWLSARFMLIAPSIMMEGISGKTAFRRSAELVKRSYRTVLATTLLVYIVPSVLAIVFSFFAGSVVKAYFPKEPAAETVTIGENAENKNDINISVNGSSVQINDGKRKIKTPEEKRAGELRETLSGGIFELLWMPITVLLGSFTSVITALIYFKTRLAGGESMQDLLDQFEDNDRPKSKWQERVEQRLIQSGRITSKT